MNKAVFLDRDGVINKEASFISRWEDFEFLPGVAKAIKALNSLGFLVVVVTNQAVVARNELSEEGLIKLHEKMIAELANHGARLDRVYYCPHHPDKGFPGENQKYKVTCDCRKPKTGMFFQAKKELDINLSDSYMVGDSTRDILAGKNAGCTTILVETGYAGSDGKHEVEPDFKAKDLPEAVDLIRKGFYKPATTSEL